MERKLLLIISVIMLLMSFQITILADDTENLLTDEGFESGTLSNANSWKFTGGTNWYGYGDAGNFWIETTIKHSGENSVMLKNAMIGQRVHLEAGKKYKLSARIYSTKFYSTVDMGFYDGSKEWPGSNGVKVPNKSFDWENDWGEAVVIFDCEKTQDYIIGFFENKDIIYIDDVVLCETEEEEVSQYQVEGDYSTVSGNYDKNRLLNVSRGGYLINRNKYWMPSLYDKMSEDGVNMVRMDWILSDQFYHIVSEDESGNLSFNFELLDAAILPLLKKGMTPFMCMTAFPSVLGGTKNRGENTSGLSGTQLEKFGECVEAVAKHYVDMGYTGWYWESDNEPEDGKTGNVNKICEKYGVFAKSVHKIDPTAKIGGIGYRNADVGKETGWKTTFFTYLKNNPDIPFDFISIHQYNQVTNFDAAEAFVDLLEQTAPERKNIPVIFSEWNYDWTVGKAGSEKDTNVNAAYTAKRLSTALVQDNVDYVFYFTPSDAWTPANVINGDSGLYTIDGHRKSAANTFALYNDLEGEIITPRANMESDKKKNISGFVTKNDETERVTALVFNYTGSANNVDLKIDNLPYAGKNIKVTTKEINEDSGNYYKDYADGYRGYDVTPNELPNETVSVTNGASEYSDTLSMQPYSVVEVVLEPTDDSVSSPSLKEKDTPKINLAINKKVFSNSTGRDGVVEKNSKTADFDFSTIKEKTTETDSDQYLIEAWNTASLTDGYRLSFDRTNSQGAAFDLSNLGYRSEAFDSADNNVWVTVKLDKTCSVNEVKLYPVSNLLDDGQGFPVDFTIQTSVDGENWVDVVSKTGYSSGKVTGVQDFSFDDTETWFVRVNATKLTRAEGGYRLQLAEIEVYGNPDEEVSDIPEPKDPEEPEEPKPSASPEEPDEERIIIKAAGKNVNITSFTNIDEAVIIKASYKADGTLENVNVSDKIELKKGENSVELSQAVKSGDKIMVWSSVDSMKPYGSLTIRTNKLADGDIEEAAEFADSKWKPSSGMWKKGLGTSVDIDTETVSSNSTKSAKITNAALLQAVGLDGGENYTLSFDIYFGDSFDKSKLSWGIFGLADNGYIGTIGCGYNGGTAVTESKFDPNKKNEWQHVETEFLCPSDAKYAVEFLYGASDSVYIDNVCVSGNKPAPYTVEQHDVSYTDKLGRDINLYGQLYVPSSGSKNGVIILSHGYNAYADAYAAKCEFFAKNGYAAYAFDFCGGSTVSKSTGRLSTEMTLFTETEDLVAVFDNLSKLDCIDENNMFLSGDSQGGMVSALAAEELGDDKVRGMALQFPAFGIPDVWRNEEPNLPRDHWGLTLGKVFATSVKDFYTFKYVGKNYTNNLLIISGTSDPVVPISSVRQAVNSVYKNGTLVEFEGEGHGFSAAKEAEARQLMLDFLKTNTVSE